MNFNENTRRKVSKILIDKAEKMLQDEENFKGRISNTAKNVCSPDSDDYKNRSLLMDYINNYVAVYNELSELDHYEWNGHRISAETLENYEKEKAKREEERKNREYGWGYIVYPKKEEEVPKATPNLAVDFIKNLTYIDVSKYIPEWSGGSYIDGDKNQPTIIEDCAKFWQPFYMANEAGKNDNTLKENSLWSTNPTKVRAGEESDSKPILPTKENFMNCVSPFEDYDKYSMIDIIKQFNEIKNAFIKDGEFIKKDYTVTYLKHKGFGQEDEEIEYHYNIVLPERKDRISRSDVSGTSVTYELSGTASCFVNAKDFEIEGITSGSIVDDGMKTSEGIARDISNKFENGERLFFGNSNSYCIGRVYSHSFEKVEEYKSHKGSDGTYYNVLVRKGYEVYVKVDFERRDHSSLYLAKSEVWKNMLPMSLKYLNLMKSSLEKTYEGYMKSNENVKNKTANPEQNYSLFIRYINDYIYTINNSGPYMSEYSIISFMERMTNTLTNTVLPWLQKRKEIILETLKDDFIPKGIESIITERMDKNDGTLYSWYTQDVLPLTTERKKMNKARINSEYIFKAGLLAKPDAGIDYTQEDNGGKKLTNPNFIDVPKEIYKYYGMAGINNVSFNVGDKVYLIDDKNPEIECRITNISNKRLVTGAEEDKNGNQVKKWETVNRIYINRSIPTPITNYENLRIVKEI